MHQEAYDNFFGNSEAGKYFMAELLRTIDSNHEKAENTPELARDFVQRAKGNRDILEHIQSVAAVKKKGKTTE